MAGGGEGIVGSPGRGHGTGKPGPAGGRLEFPVPPVLPCDFWGPSRGRNVWSLPNSKAFPTSPQPPAARVPWGPQEEPCQPRGTERGPLQACAVPVLVLSGWTAGRGEAESRCAETVWGGERR